MMLALTPFNPFASDETRRRVLLDHAAAYDAAGMPRSAALAFALATGPDAVRQLVSQPGWWHPEDETECSVVFEDHHISMMAA